MRYMRVILLALTSTPLHTLTVLSLLPVYITFSPPHRTTFTLAACPVKTNSSFLVDVFHIRTVPSFEAVAIRGVKDFSLTR